ncbi:Zinc carboxypeptidase domain protein [Enhygromyxa salina]|uniref:Zinc carboxypeptidase domain protein n=1 Tax=Enhygromyxa salina TaxID=215803 RepID=A0A0C1Z5F6_9BACT|nr:M14-type cytosolic carboxypeptidase [Enhygromyxa salina]KIG12834.1 Zinc carboxypeptidase domain protein [Enhygromyxa salina]
MHISDSFDAGNIEVLDASDPTNVQLEIRKDHGSDHFQWFYFRVSGVRGVALNLRLTNAGKASYVEGWNGYHACYSYDRQTWRRVADTSYADGTLSIRHAPDHDAVWYAYFAPYSIERHHDLVARSLQSPLVKHELLGRTLDGQDLDLLRVTHAGAAPSQAKKQCWVFARQHPGESMAEHLMDGLLARLLDPTDPVSRTLLAKADFWIVPNMNPDGSRRGHLRTNASGANLNREWLEPSMERSPEVYLVREKMRATGLHFALDVHGDEALPYNFIAGPDGVASVSEATRALQAEFEAELAAANPDFQTKHGYPVPAPGQANMTMATNWIADAFGALSMTLEMPFKDNANLPDPEFGWSPARCERLGHGALAALLRVVDRLGS